MEGERRKPIISHWNSLSLNSKQLRHQIDHSPGELETENSELPSMLFYKCKPGPYRRHSIESHQTETFRIQTLAQAESHPLADFLAIVEQIQFSAPRPAGHSMYCAFGHTVSAIRFEHSQGSMFADRRTTSELVKSKLVASQTRLSVRSSSGNGEQTHV